CRDAQETRRRVRHAAEPPLYSPNPVEGSLKRPASAAARRRTSSASANSPSAMWMRAAAAQHVAARPRRPFRSALAARYRTFERQLRYHLPHRLRQTQALEAPRHVPAAAIAHERALLEEMQQHRPYEERIPAGLPGDHDDELPGHVVVGQGLQ